MVTRAEVKETWQKQSDDKTKSGTKLPACQNAVWVSFYQLEKETRKRNEEDGGGGDEKDILRNISKKSEKEKRERKRERKREKNGKKKKSRH